MNNIRTGEDLFRLILDRHMNAIIENTHLSFPDIDTFIIEKDITNIMFILINKFKKWSLRYPFSTLDTTYDLTDYTLYETYRIIRDIYPSYYWMKKKNMITILDSFADMNNWGQREKFAIKQLIVENYIPLNNDIETPHTSTPTTTDQNNQYIDFIKYYQSINMLDNKLYDNLYTQFLPLMKTIYI